MISIVTPTIWAFDPFLNFLSRVVELNCVDEVIIINNLVQDTPDHKVLLHPKVKMQNMVKNIYVNPAWNLGVSLAKNDKICILSDDVLVDLRVFSEADDFISKEIGLLCIGTKHDVFNLHNNKFGEILLKNLIVTGDITIKNLEECHGETAGLGSLFFIHKDNWIVIPEDFKINFGDTWQLNVQTHFNRKNYFINNCFYYSPWNASTKKGVPANSIMGLENETPDVFSSTLKKFKESNT